MNNAKLWIVNSILFFVLTFSGCKDKINPEGPPKGSCRVTTINITMEKVNVVSTSETHLNTDSIKFDSVFHNTYSIFVDLTYNDNNTINTITMGMEDSSGRVVLNSTKYKSNLIDGFGDYDTFVFDSTQKSSAISYKNIRSASGNVLETSSEVEFANMILKFVSKMHIKFLNPINIFVLKIQNSINYLIAKGKTQPKIV